MSSPSVTTGSSDSPDDQAVFAETFLLGGASDLPTLEALRSPGHDIRKKRAHRKSRCTAATEFGTGRGFDGEPLHMELFYHAFHTTIPGLTLYKEIWTDLMKLSFQTGCKSEYLVNAMLAMTAQHLSVSHPEIPRYQEAAMVLLAKCCAEFRHVLDLEMTEENRDQVLGTGILIHYLCWCDTSFLDGQQRNLDGTYRQLDLSQDRLFLLSEGVRHVRFLSWQLSNPEGSIFWKLVIEKKCAVLREVFMQCGLDYARLRPRVIALYDDPRFIGNGRDDSSATSDNAAPGTAKPAVPGSREGLPFWTVPCTHLFSDAHILSILALQVPPADNDKNPVEQKLYDRLSFEIVADRISLIIHLTLLREAEKAEGARSCWI
ncbi:unnamed protein product [Parascedosporium putredinis]|uniref:Uncharacterized protein n=1 Tax=Parascedosporium putredinis TaxID=1442378 RepID=A0A9P1H8R5_9PEZI|nr:unnamed protein product [Parascedosporium putredinis]CAI8000092.1 unnamed protein product [Parascedosporium putredinis]